MKQQGMMSRRQAIVGGSAIVASGAALGVEGAQARAGTRKVEGTRYPATPDRRVAGLTTTLSDYIASAGSHEVPEAIRDRARLHVLDTLASIIACHDLEAARLARRYAAAMSVGGSPILGSSVTAGAIDAVFASAMAGHAAEINDFIPSAYVQPGPAIVSAALEAARSRSRSGRALVSAIIVGYEIAGRLPKALGTRNLYNAGLANHGVAPTFGAATATAPLLGLSADQINHMLAYCAQQASGSWQWLLDVRHVEKAFVFAGMGARNGVQAAHMARLGFTGVPDSFDQENGWLRGRAFRGPGADPASLVEGLNARWELSLAAMKRYPVGGPAQPAVQALIDLRRTVTPDQVAGITIAMPGEAATFERAQMPALNIPYLAAIIMLDGKLDFVSAQSLERQATDRAATAFASLVTVVRDEAQETGEGADRTESARVTIRLRDGTVEERYVPHVPGFPSHPLSKGQVEDKARELVDPVLGRAAADRLVALCEDLDSAASIAPIIDLMRVPAR